MTNARLKAKSCLAESSKLIYAEYVFRDKDDILHVAEEVSYYDEEDTDEVGENE